LYKDKCDETVVEDAVANDDGEPGFFEGTYEQIY